VMSMRAVMRKRRVIGTVAAALALVAGMFATPASATAAQGGGVDCFLTPPDPPGDTLWLTWTFDPETETLGTVNGGWAGIIECGTFLGGNSVQRVDIESQLWLDSTSIGLDDAECDLERGDPSCDDIGVSAPYMCDLGVDCAGTYGATYISHTVMLPGVFWNSIPDNCQQVRPPPEQVVDCQGTSNKIVVPMTSGG
jgi:hypothetical protein